MPSRVAFTDEAKQDLAALPSRSLQLIALQWLQRLIRNPNVAEPLDRRAGADLAGAFKIYFDEGGTPLKENFIGKRRSEVGARYRIVFCPTPGDPDKATILGVGPKFGPKGSIYAICADRYALFIESESRD